MNLEDKDVFKMALDIRNLEISLFWQRSNYFLVLNSALALGFFKIEDQKYTLGLAFFGCLVSFLWFRVNLGGKYWQSRWERRISIIEEKIAPELNFFTAKPEALDKDVGEMFPVNESSNCLDILLRKLVLQKPSVSRSMILLSLLFLSGWIILVCINLWSLVTVS